MKKKIVGIFICMLFVVSSLPSICSFKNLYDRVDQQQLIKYGAYSTPYPNLFAQSFKPALDILTRVEIFIKKYTYPDPTDKIFIYIRDNLDGANLVSKWVYLSSISSTSYTWIEFDFSDIGVTIDKTYYIILDPGSSSNKLGWGTSNGDVYLRGKIWRYDTEVHDWYAIWIKDFTFKTYGYNQSENPPPYQPSRPSGPDSGYCGVFYNYSTITTDPNDDEVRYGWDWDGDGLIDEWSEFISTMDIRQHSFSSAGKYNVHVKAEDPHGKQSEWSQVLEVTIENGTLIVNAGGPYIEVLENSIQFNGEVTNGSGPYTWVWDFGDGTTAEIQNPIHTYENIGIYNISLTVTDNEGKVGTDKTTATIRVNNPPDKPTITGETNGKTDTEYEYKFISTDPEEDNIEYYIDWGDNSGEVCIGPYESGIEVSTMHSWSEEGEYTIKVKAKDTYGAESNWTTLEITMPKTHIHNPILELLMKIVKCFPFFESILNQIV